MELAAAEPAAGAVAEVPAAQEDLLADIEGLTDVDWDAPLQKPLPPPPPPWPIMTNSTF